MTNENNPVDNMKLRRRMSLGQRTGSPGWLFKTTAIVTLLGSALGLAAYINSTASDSYNAAMGEKVPSPYSLVASLGPDSSSGQPGLSLTAPIFDHGSPQAAAAEEEETSPVKQAKVMRGDTLAGVLVKAGVELADAHSAITALSEHFNMRRLREGQEIELTFSPESEPTLQTIRLQPDVERAVTVERQDDGSFASTVQAIELAPHSTRAGGRISDSLYMAMQKAGVPHNVISEFIRVYSWDVDFQREIQPGDTFEIFFERFEDDAGQMVKTGPLLYAGLTLSGKPHSLYLYTPSDDKNPDYFDAQGHSVRKALLKTPIDGARLTSGFGKRRHPILGYTKMHKGLDFGASKGTPIHAAGDGVIEKAGMNGAYGNYVRVKHNGQFATAYAHMSGYGKGIKAGARVRQGDIIGYVGSTGRSTGPHLHYEVLNKGKQVDPRDLKMPTGRQLDGPQLMAFKKSVQDLNVQIAAIPMATTLASNQ
jgi:murein DD-endopeptidase MepM/ murein hydrolase activator NlpD